MSIMPVVIILSVGTKLQGIICRMAIDITERHAVIQGIPLVQVSDSYFWFAKPTFVLFLIHFTLFQNGFQIIYTSSGFCMSTGWTRASTTPKNSSVHASALGTYDENLI
ncbi:unnamed protein product [Miscanthus lutarioriparius]|uniref:Uncharacterized protein n=1 Tax=Miscanthus lutarioriparius TaxID=422564 RepID=A0A811R1C1_9POAL|nr:unnamed protein product [Miscanthus lutarioriparius]